MAELEVEAKLNITAIFEDGINDVEKSKKPPFSIRLLILFKFFIRIKKYLTIIKKIEKSEKSFFVYFGFFWILEIHKF